MPKESIKFLKVRDVKSPFRAFQYDAGIDFFVPVFNKQFIADLKEKNPLIFNPPCTCSPDHYVLAGSSGSLSMTGTDSQVTWDLNDENDTLFKMDDEKGENYLLLPPGSRIMIPSGIKSRMEKPGRALIAGNKSGVATKHGLVFGAQVVDYTYKGEIHLSLINTSTKNVRIYENMKILQFLETPVFNSEVKVEESFYEYPGPAKPGKPVSPYEIKFYEGLENDRGAGGFGSTDKKEETKINKS